MATLDSPAPNWLFVADHVALDFINTAYGVGENHTDCLGSDQQVLDWLRRAGLTDEFDALPPSGRKGGLLKSALALRDQARELLERRKAQLPAEVSVLNQVLALGNVHQELVWSRGQAPVLRRHRSGSSPDAVLAPLAESIAQLMVEGDFALIRKCESSDCTLWFYDRTKSHHRRWCSMTQCGNRAKVAAFRERRKKS